MADGSTKPIDEVEVGDWVLAADPATGEQGARQVTDVIAGSGFKQLVELTIEGDTLTATDRHPFWVTDDAAWVDAADLEPGDRLLLADGSTVAVEAVREYTVEAIVHNLSVDDLHTYYVVTGDDAALVHNCGYVDLAPDRRTHILSGNRKGGGHRYGTGRGKTEFPADWSDNRIMHEISDIATDPAAAARPGKWDTTILSGERGGIQIEVITRPNGSIITGHPVQ